MGFGIRRAEIEDAAGIAAVQVESWRSTYAGIVPESFLASMDVEVGAQRWTDVLSSGESLIFVAEDASGIFGFVSGGKLRQAVEDYDAELYAIYLLGHSQRRGVGRSLTMALVRELRERGFRSLLVWVLEQNPSVGFYRQLGGVQVAQQMIQIGGVDLSEIAFGWVDFDALICVKP